MALEVIKIADLKHDGSNARVHGDKNTRAIEASLSKFGQQKPIVIDSNNIVKAGNGTLAAAIKLGWETLNCVRSNLTGLELKAYAVADNRTSDLASWDHEILMAQLMELEGYDAELRESAGYDDADMGLIMAMFDDSEEGANSPAEEWQNMPEFKQDNIAHRSMIVHFTSQEDFAKFVKLMKQPIGDKTKFIWYPEAKRAETVNLRYSEQDQEVDSK